MEDLSMLRLAVMFLVIALLAAAFGFYGVAGIAWDGARIFVLVFLVLAVLTALGGYGYGRRGEV
jgi:uncharacterized membrane protein YtjA (UPF0391 family)